MSDYPSYLDDEIQEVRDEVARLKRELLWTRAQLYLLQRAQFEVNRYFRKRRKDPLSQLIDSGLLKLESGVRHFVRWLAPDRKKK